MSMTRRITGYLLALLLVFTGQAHSQLALTGAGKGVVGSGGGGGGDTVAVSTGVAAFADGVGDGVTGSASPAGANRALFMGVTTVGFGAASTIDDAKYGGSAGTSLAKIGTDESYSPGDGTAAAYGIAGSPSGSTTLWADWSGTPPRGYLAGAFLVNVNQTTPFEGRTANQGVDGDNTSVVGSVTITGLISGQKAIAAFACIAGGGDIQPFTAGSGTTVVTQVTDIIGGIAILYGTASGTSLTLSGTCSQVTSNFLAWKVIGVRINPA